MNSSEHTMLIQVTSEKALGLLRQLESLELIKVLEENVQHTKPRLSHKYRGKLPSGVIAVRTNQTIKKLDGY